MAGEGKSNGGASPIELAARGATRGEVISYRSPRVRARTRRRRRSITLERGYCNFEPIDRLKRCGDNFPDDYLTAIRQLVNGKRVTRFICDDCRNYLLHVEETRRREWGLISDNEPSPAEIQAEDAQRFGMQAVAAIAELLFELEEHGLIPRLRGACARKKPR